MNHYPADADKPILKLFSADKSMGMEIHTIAGAMMKVKTKLFCCSVHQR